MSVIAGTCEECGTTYDNLHLATECLRAQLASRDATIARLRGLVQEVEDCFDPMFGVFVMKSIANDWRSRALAETAEPDVLSAKLPDGTRKDGGKWYPPLTPSPDAGRAEPETEPLKPGDTVVDARGDGEGVVTAADDGRGSCRVAWSDGGLYDIVTSRLRRKEPGTSTPANPDEADRLRCPECGELWDEPIAYYRHADHPLGKCTEVGYGPTLRTQRAAAREAGRVEGWDAAVEMLMPESGVEHDERFQRMTWANWLAARRPGGAAPDGRGKGGVMAKKWPEKIVVGEHPLMGRWWTKWRPSLPLQEFERVYILAPAPKRPRKKGRRR